MAAMSPIAEQPQPTVVAAFDFDGTLTTRDSLLPFLHMVVGRWRFIWGLIITSPALISYALKLIPNWQAKESVLTHFLKGLTEQRLQQLGQRFATQKMSKLLRPAALQRLRWHREHGHHIVLVSASLEAYLIPWAESMRFDQVAGTQLEVQDGYLTGRILGKNCYGPEKVKRLQAMLGDLSQYCIYAYGDSRGDRELLDVANYPYYRVLEDAQEQNAPV